MSTTLIVILGVIAALIVLILVLGMTGPRSFLLARSKHIAAPAERVFPLIEDFHNWTQWSPFENIDLALKRSYSGALKGKGAVYEWEGRKAGAGRMEIVDAPTPRKVTIDLQFTRPMKAQNVAEFTLQPDAGGTTVTWTMTGAMPFMNRLMTKFVSMEKMVGGAFEEGLAAMKAKAEAA